MKLLIITQKVDRNDPILGFFHRWLLEFAKHYEKLTVICLEKGEYDLPQNVKVLSLGKEKGNTKFDYLCWFYQYIWDERKNYDAVFVHMNQEYVLLGALCWKLWGKKVFMWRNHPLGSWLTRVAVALSDKVFCTSKQSYTAKFGKTKLMPAGIDTELFKPDISIEREKDSILFLGRIAPVKRVREFLDWLEGREYNRATIAGPIGDKVYGELIFSRISSNQKISYIGPVTQDEAVNLYQTHETYVNFTPAGSLDKTVLEAAACGARIIVENPDLKNLEGVSGSEAREYVLRNHSLNVLAERLKDEMKPSTTSIHSLNADAGLNTFEKVAYLLLNWGNNLFPYANIDPRIEIKVWDGKGWEGEWNNTYKESSAARKSSDIFWRTLPWEKIKEELGEINVFDTGCGHGNYGVRIEEGSKGLINSYTGIDAKRRPNWEELEKTHKNFHFIESRSSNILPLIPTDTNLFITQSAIEHFDEDLTFFRQIKAFIERSSKPVMQVHLFPASATLSLYLFHGYRQYTPRTVSKITRLFDNNYEFFLYGLGGSAGKKLHFRYFTWPVLITRKQVKPSFDVDTYEKELRQAFEHDVKKPSRSPLFWALVIRRKGK